MIIIIILYKRNSSNIEVLRHRLHALLAGATKVERKEGFEPRLRLDSLRVILLVVLRQSLIRLVVAVQPLQIVDATCEWQLVALR